MGQAQRSDRRDTISVIYGNGSRSRDGKNTREGAKKNEKRRRAEKDHLQGLEMWELSRESDNPRMMRLADREQARSVQARSMQSRSVQVRSVQRRPAPVRQSAVRPRSANAARRRSARRRKVFLYRCFTLFMIAVCLILIYQTTGAVYRMVHEQKRDRTAKKDKGIIEAMSEKLGDEKIQPPAITEDFLEVNEYSRPGTKVEKVKSIFVHYTANPGTSAQQNRSYFANLAQTHERSASAHFIIGYDGDLVQCIPLEEQAYAVATRNEDSISIECCYQDENGKFTKETYDTLVHTLAWLTQEYGLSTEDILRHYDCGGKLCPIYYVENEDAWEQLLSDVENYEPESKE